MKHFIFGSGAESSILRSCTRAAAPWCVLVSALLCAVACGDPLKYAQTLEETRVIGVRVEGPEGRAALAAGEPARLEVLLAGPGGPQDVVLAYVVCPAIDSARGVPQCGDEPYQLGETGSASLPTFSFDTPETASEGQRVALLAVACQNGQASLQEDPLNWACDEGEERALRFSFDFEVLSDSLNQNPDLSELQLSYNGEAIDVDSLDEPADCDEAPAIGSQIQHQLSIDLGQGARQAELDELLQVSLFSTSGRFERQFTILDPEESLRFELEWDASDSAEAVKNYLVVRDDSGGVSWASWSICAR